MAHIVSLYRLASEVALNSENPNIGILWAEVYMQEEVPFGVAPIIVFLTGDDLDVHSFPFPRDDCNTPSHVSRKCALIRVDV